MKRSYFLSRRLHHRAPTRTRTRSLTLKGKSKKSLSTRKQHAKGRRRVKGSRRVKGGGVGETVDTMNGIPVSNDAVVTNAKGVTRSVKNREMWWNRAETGELLGDDDI